jgi:tetratricopeptide (TPR) repeat protein
MRTLLLSAALTLVAASPAFADSCDDRVRAVQGAWEHINYEVPKSARTADMEKLSAQADGYVKQCPGRAEPLIWDAIVTASAGGLKGGLGGLGMAKEAKAMLEQAERINPAALDGSVYTSLGSLYTQVPGAPIGFGDKTKARSYLQKALAANPNGIDSNYFMGDYLMRQRDYAGAVRYLTKALNAPARPGRELADRGRRAEAQTLLERARQKAK